MRVLFIQTRKEPDLRDQELEGVCRLGGISRKDLIVCDGTKDPEKKLLEDIDVICLGGSGTHSVTTDSPERLEAYTQFLHAARARHLPMIGIDYGGYLLTVAFGGTVICDPGNKEIGVTSLLLRKEAENDALFSQLPPIFLAVVAHLDRIASCPPGCVCLAEARSQSCEAWTFPGERIYGIAFHPELDNDSLTRRLVYYQERFSSEPGDLEHIVLHLKPTPDANRILPLFFMQAEASVSS